MPRSLLWVELCPLRRYAETLIAVPVNVTLFGNRVFADVIKMEVEIILE